MLAVAVGMPGAAAALAEELGLRVGQTKVAPVASPVAVAARLYTSITQ